MNSNQPRPGLTEAAFRKYEVILEHASLHYPKAFKLNVPEGTSQFTLVGRLRDAIKSHKDFNWPTNWDSSLVSKLSVHNTNDGIFISGAKRLDGGVKPLSVNPVASSTSKTYHFRLEHLEAFCLLISAGHIKGPIEFTLDEGIDPFNLEALFDVAIIPDGTNKYILS